MAAAVFAPTPFRATALRGARMIHTHEWRANRLGFVFARSGGPGRFTKRFGDLDGPTQVLLIERAHVAAPEVPAIGGYIDERSWVLVTSARIVWSDDGRSESLDLVALSGVTLKPEHLAAHSKMTVSELTIEERDGTQHVIRLEPGAPFFGIWNALRWACLARESAV